MPESFVGEMILFAGNFAPTGYALCNGQLLSIAQNTALFSILGTTYGGNGTTTFALPNMQGRLSIGEGNGPGLSSYVIGQAAGEETHTLLTNEMPGHSHTLTADVNGTTQGTDVPGATVLLGSGYANEANTPPESVYSTDAPTLTSGPTGLGGGNQPHDNRMPSLVVNWCIALFGVFPSRN
jgi:microcystin-dependent protein